MTITVKFFAEYRDWVDTPEQQVALKSGQTMADIWQSLTQKPVPEYLLCARNLEYVDLLQQAEVGDEIAFFPPVTGG